MAHNLTVEYATLLALATKVQKNAHAPYSNFHVGAAILDENAQHYGGCNVENAAYPLSQCAEAGAISAMIAAGGKQIKQILVASPNNDFCPPCGGCRQKIAEFANAQTEVHLVTKDGQVKTVKFEALLPLAFGFDNK